ncbi:MAG: CDP-alcohol phosphatidyltransferase family protein [Spirochaetota bacterium]
MKDYFRLEPSGEKLSSINFTNLITLYRLSSLPTISYLIILSIKHAVKPVLLIFTSVCFITDLFDGFIARKTNQVTRIGKYMDSASDYSLLFVISIALIIFKLIPLWFFILITFRLLYQGLAEIVLFYRRGYLKHDTSFLGKASIFATMVLYAFEILREIDIPFLGNKNFVNILEYLAGIIVAASIVDKFLLFRRIIPPKKSTSEESAAGKSSITE